LPGTYAEYRSVNVNAKKKSEKSRRPRPVQKPLCEEQPAQNAREQDMEPGLYRVRIERCEAVRPQGCGWRAEFEFGVRAPQSDGVRFKLLLDTEQPDESDLLCRVFAVLGGVVEDPEDFALACREVVGRHAFVEVLARGVVHVQQLATTHTVASPVDRLQAFPDIDNLPYEDIDKPEDLTDPESPRFYGCDTEAKAELRLHPNEHVRVLRAQHGRA
jgi:hypothetical protein